MSEPKVAPIQGKGRVSGKPETSQTPRDAAPGTQEAETEAAAGRDEARLPTVRENTPGNELTGPRASKLEARRRRRELRQLQEAAQPPSVVLLQGLASPTVPKARPRRRHLLMVISFALMVVLPGALAIAYLYTRAVDSYASTAAFSVHMEDSPTASGLLTGMSALGVAGTQSPDADVLEQFIQSQALVQTIDAELDLRSIYSGPHDQDPYFALDPDATLEELVDYWHRVVTLVLEPDSGLITLEVRAFTAEEAQRVLNAILDESASLIDRLSKIARDDTIRLAKEELGEAEQRLRDIRLEVGKFRDVEQIVDPTADLAGQMGVISALQQSLAEAMIRRDMLIGTTTNDDDPRLQQSERTIEAIRRRIEDERHKIGARQAGDSSDPLSRVVGEYEELLVDREFAEQSYLAAMTAYDQAVAEARRKSRYLAVHISPTLAETAVYPQRTVLSLTVLSLLTLIWALFILVAYSIRDRR